MIIVMIPNPSPEGYKTGSVDGIVFMILIDRLLGVRKVFLRG
jgi:hypothetical protein